MTAWYPGDQRIVEINFNLFRYALNVVAHTGVPMSLVTSTGARVCHGWPPGGRQVDLFSKCCKS